MTLAAVSLPYYRYIMTYGLNKFKRFAINVWNVDAKDKTDEEIALEGLKAIEDWMNELNLVMHLKDLNVTEDMIEGIVNATIIMQGGYKVLNHEEIVNILKESM